MCAITLDITLACEEQLAKPALQVSNIKSDLNFPKLEWKITAPSGYSDNNYLLVGILTIPPCCSCSDDNYLLVGSLTKKVINSFAEYT